MLGCWRIATMWLSSAMGSSIHSRSVLGISILRPRATVLSSPPACSRKSCLIFIRGSLISARESADIDEISASSAASSVASAVLCARGSRTSRLSASANFSAKSLADRISEKSRNADFGPVSSSPPPSTSNSSLIFDHSLVSRPARLKLSPTYECSFSSALFCCLLPLFSYLFWYAVFPRRTWMPFSVGAWGADLREPLRSIFLATHAAALKGQEVNESPWLAETAHRRSERESRALKMVTPNSWTSVERCRASSSSAVGSPPIIWLTRCPVAGPIHSNSDWIAGSALRAFITSLEAASDSAKSLSSFPDPIILI
mmetsp:Transcript_32227/g.76584  ORF Transcript_32227/g.76584 Transcript_32227/m.76584 type:complete len:315 (-) Transcript_32227:680-1624(-)